MLFRTALLLALSALAGCGGDVPPPKAAEPQSAEEWIKSSEATLSRASSAQWRLELQIDRAPEKLFGPGKHRYSFRVRGSNRVHWTEEHDTGGKKTSVEAWYDGQKLYVRNSATPDRLDEMDFGDDEGDCVRLSMIRGGVVGWQLVHMTVLGGLQVDNPRFVRFETCEGRPAAVIDHEMKLGGICGRYENLPGCRVWIDRERQLVLKREYAMTLKVGDKEVPVTGREILSDWILDAAIDDSAFRTAGMKPPSARGALPEDPEAFEVAMTERLTGVKLQSLGAPGKTTTLDTPGLTELKLDVETLGEMADPDSTKDEEGLPAPRHDRPMGNAVARRGPDGKYVEAWDGRHGDLEVEPTKWFEPETFENRRHRYKGMGGYVGFSIYIGPVEGSRMSPVLTFRDPGFQSHGPLDMAIDGEGRCHLLFPDVDPTQEDRVKLLYLVGDLAGHHWTRGWILQIGSTCPAVSMLQDGENVWMTWCKQGGDPSLEVDGVYFVGRSGDRFTDLIQVWRGRASHVGMARDPKGSILLVWKPDDDKKEKEFMACVRRPTGSWTRPAAMELGWASITGGIGVFGTGENRYRLRIYDYKSGYRRNGLFEKVRQWNIKASSP